jgi:hypothetical protein
VPFSGPLSVSIPNHLYALGIEARIQRQQVKQASGEKACASDQENGKRRLEAHEPAANSNSTLITSHVVHTFF